MPVVRPLVAALAALVLLVGCSQGGTVGVATAEMHPQFRVVSNASSTVVSVTLFRGVGGFDRLQLTSDEALTARPVGGDPVALSVVAPDTLSVRYEATLPALAPGDELVIALSRPFEDDAPDTRVTIPPAPEVTAPASGSELQPDQPFVVAWTPFAEDAVEVRFALTTCDGLTPEELEVVAALVGLPGRLEDGPAGTAETTFFPGGSTLVCRADLLVGRVAEDVDLDPAFGGLRPNTRIVREAPARALSFAP